VTVGTIAEYLKAIEDWQKQHGLADPAAEDGFLGQLWYRGVNRHYPHQVPGVYRPNFTARAGRHGGGGDGEERRRRVECEMIAQFRSGGAAFLGDADFVEIYFLAQHFGMPTRLLDWSTNPLAALFFACEGTEFAEDGYIYAMDARKVIPAGAMKIKPDATGKGGEKLHQAVMTMRHPYVGYAVGLSYWNSVIDNNGPYILPVRPDIVPGRIGQQSSCFTLHMHRAGPMDNSTLGSIKVDARRKGPILTELRQASINQFTTYYDLDHLSKEIKHGWGVERPAPDFFSVACRLLTQQGPTNATLDSLKELFGPDPGDKIRQAAGLFENLAKLLPPKP
jgi:hypothetical protein